MRVMEKIEYRTYIINESVFVLRHSLEALRDYYGGITPKEVDTKLGKLIEELTSMLDYSDEFKDWDIDDYNFYKVVKYKNFLEESK